RTGRTESDLQHLQAQRQRRIRSLYDFLRNASSTRALANRADVDVDRFATPWTDMLHNPADFMLACWQYALSVQQQVWERSLPSSSPKPSSPSLVDWTETFREQTDPFLQLFEAPPSQQRATGKSVGEARDILQEAHRHRREFRTAADIT